MLLCPRTDKAAGLFPEAIDFFLLDQPVDQTKGVGGVRQQPLGPLGLHLRGPAGEAFADIDATADGAAIAGARARAELFGFEHDRVDAVLRQFERRRQPGISAADDRDARRSRHVDEVAGGRRVSFPPIRDGCEITVEDVGNHPPQFLKCTRAMRVRLLPPAARGA